MPFGITERDVEVAAAVIAATPLIEAPQLPAPCWHGLARLVLEEVERERNRVSQENWRKSQYSDDRIYR